MEVTAVDVRDRFPIFTNFLFRDMVFFIVGMSLIFVIMGLYLKSFLITIFTLFDVVFSFGIAYFLFLIVFDIPHFPVLAFLSILLLIAIAADDVFILYGAYEQAKEAHPDKDMTHWMATALEHAALSILVTSLTTDAALFANVVSDITDIKAFGIVSGTAVVINYVLVVTWIPSAIISVEKINNKCFSKINCCQCFEKFTAKLKQISITIFHRFLPACVRKLWFIWLFLFLGLGTGGIVVTFVSPKLELPTSKDFALFSKNSPIEAWDQDLKYKFRFHQRENEALNLVALWGVVGEDNGNHLDPKSLGDLKFESSFDLSHPESQVWMTNFCHDLINAPFFDKAQTQGVVCTMDVFNSYLISNCSKLQESLGTKWTNNLSDCCGLPSTPVAPDVFKTCYFYFTFLLSSDLNSYLGKAFYSNDSTEMKAYDYRFVSTQARSATFQIMDNHYKETQDWMNGKLSTAPSGLEKGWLTSAHGEFELYDLQLSLASGTNAAIGVSMAAASVVMLVTSLNVIITFCAILTIFLIISAAVGTLVLLHWELNIVESVALTMAVGLSIDFCIHYGMAYRLSTCGDRKLRVQESFEKVGAAIFMAAGTTFIAGASVMPSIVLFYVQLGSFLMLVMAFSWLFSTFFFQSLCYVIGPNGNFCQIPSPCQLCQKDDTSIVKSDKTKIATSQNEVISSEKQNWSGKENPGYNTEPNKCVPPYRTSEDNWPKRERLFTDTPENSPTGFRSNGLQNQMFGSFSRGDKSHSLAHVIT